MNRICIRSTLSAMTALVVIAAFFLLVSMSFGCQPGFAQVRDNLDEQREIYGLPPTHAQDCAELVGAFEGYVEQVTYTVPATDPNWETLAASECRTLESHLRAFDEVCPETTYEVPSNVAENCAAAGVIWTR